MVWTRDWGKGREQYECNIVLVSSVRTAVFAVCLREESEHDAHGYENEESLGGVQANLDILELRLR